MNLLEKVKNKITKIIKKKKGNIKFHISNRTFDIADSSIIELLEFIQAITLLE